ncbi:HAD family phosphatase [Streptomyces sp. NPDC047108]|uniref:HAD family hydrolase n=1 Tax=Streptomyces sp. NPDC047108 TaxID=3155025 RepID=UPI00340B24C7
MFDLDGPMFDFYAARRPGLERRAPETARLLEKILVEHDEPVPALPNQDDPLALYRAALESLGGRPRTPRTVALDAALRACLDDQEMAAATESAVPTPGAEAVLRELHRLGVPLAVTSNNSADAIRVLLDRTGLLEVFEGRVFGRSADHLRMKPHPDVLERALASLGATPDASLLIGDSEPDVLAAAAVGAAFLGYACSPRKARRLRAAGAGLVVTGMDEIHDALRRTAVA